MTNEAPNFLMPEATSHLLGITRLRCHSLEEQLANYKAMFKMSCEREERLMNRLSKLRDCLIHLMNGAKPHHKGCPGKAGKGVISDCKICFSIAEAEEILAEFKWS